MSVDRNDFAPIVDRDQRRLVLSDADGTIELEPNHDAGTDAVAYILGDDCGKWLSMDEARALRDALDILINEALK